MKILFLCLFLLAGCIAPRSAFAQESLYTHCIQHWTAHAAGQTCYGWAKKAGLPDLGPIGTRTPFAAYVFCREEFDERLEDATDPVSQANFCWSFATEGPEEWR